MTSKTVAPARLLTQVAGERQTGALLAGAGGGAIYLDDGAVVYAESAAAPGVGELLTASGRLAGRTWQAALDAGATGSRVGRLLLDQGHLTQGELELCVLGATYDAAYFVIAATGAPVEFKAGAQHWLGPMVRVEAAAVLRESRRRARLLDEILPAPEVDLAPVTPVTRAPRERITLTSLQWELLVHADGQRTPADLALLLGRAGYATIQELRRLAALGLIERPSANSSVRLPRARGAVAAESIRPTVTFSEPPPPSPPAGFADRDQEPQLARRKPGAKLPKDIAAQPAPDPPGTDEVLLKRIRTALRALR